MSNVEETVHSLLAPSDSERWSRCVGALHLSRGLPDVDAEYSASGSCSHWILEQGLKNGTDPASWLGQELQFGINPATGAPFKFVIDQERVDRITLVIKRIKAEPGQMWSEKRLNTSPILGVPNQQGHADIIKLDLVGAVQIYGVMHQGVLTVHDFKDGYIMKMARNNLQGLNYLAAALYEFDLVAPINALRFCIHQPKINHYDEWTYSRLEIEAFVTAIRPVAKLAYDIYHGIVEFDPAKHLNAGEEQCFWCPVRGKCPARAQRIIDMFAPLINKHEINDEILSQLYAHLDEVEQACKDFRGEALKRAMAGRTITGHKVIQGRPGNRHWKDPKKAESMLSFVLEPEKMYEPRKIISPTDAEKLLKTDGYAPLKQLVGRNPGTYSLVPLSDKHDAVVIQQFGIVPEQPK